MQNPQQRIKALHDEAERLSAAAREKSAAFLREADMHDAAVAAYKAALSAFEQSLVRGAAPEARTPSVVGRRDGPTTTMPGGEKWYKVFARLSSSYTSPYGYEDIKSAAVDSGVEITVSALRTQMMNVVNAGLFSRQGAGQFVLTDVGLEMITRPFENKPLTGGSETKAGEAGTLPGFLNPNPSPRGA